MMLCLNNARMANLTNTTRYARFRSAIPRSACRPPNAGSRFYAMAHHFCLWWTFSTAKGLTIKYQNGDL